MSRFINLLRQETQVRAVNAKAWLDLASGAFASSPELHTLRAVCALRTGDPHLAIARFLVAAQSLPDRYGPLLKGLAQTMERAGLEEAALEQWLKLVMDDPRQPEPLEQAVRLIDSLAIADLPCNRNLYRTQLPHLRAENRQALRRAIRLLGQSPDSSIIGAVWLEQGRLNGWVLDSMRPARTIDVSLYLNGGPRLIVTASTKFPVGRAFQFDLSPYRSGNGILIDVLADTGVRLAGAPLRLGPVPPSLKALAPGTPSRRPGLGVDVIIPVYRDRSIVTRCLDALLTSRSSNRTRFRLVLVNDSSPDPDLGLWLRLTALQNKGLYLETPRNLGFIGAINLALSVCRGRDLVWLNSDTRVAGDWLDRLRAAAHSAIDVASVTPLSNNAQLFSYPRPMRDNPLPDAQGTADLQRLAAAANAGEYVTVPTGVGFCLYLKAEAVAAAGRLDDRAYLLGYAEEIDYCLRLSQAGWRHLCATDVYVAHQGGASFRFDKTRLAKDNDQVLQGRYPMERAAIGTFQRQDPLSAARGRLERLWLAEQAQWDGVFLFSVKTAQRYYTYHLLRQRQQAGKRDLQVRCLTDRHGLIVLLEGTLEAPPCNLGFRLPAQRMDLIRELLALRVEDRVTVLHDKDFPPVLFDLLAAMPQRFDLIRLDESLEANVLLRTRLPANHVPYGHTRYRQKCWARLQGTQDIPSPLALETARRWVRPARPSGGGWVVVLGHGATAADQQRLRALVRLDQSQIRWLVVGAAFDAPAFVSTGRCECLEAPAPENLLDYLSWIGCRAVLNPTDRPGPDPSPFLVSRHLNIPYIGARVADGLSYLAEPSTQGFNHRALPEKLFEATMTAITLAETDSE